MARKEKKVYEAAEKAVKKTGPIVIVLVIIFLLIGGAAGAFAASYLTKSDKLELLGDRVVYLEIGEEYVESGFVASSYGRDVTDKVVLSGDTVDTTKEGIYQIVYKINGLFWGEFQRVRAVIVGDPEGLEEFLQAFEGGDK